MAQTSFLLNSGEYENEKDVCCLLVSFSSTEDQTLDLRI